MTSSGIPDDFWQPLELDDGRSFIVGELPMRMLRALAVRTSQSPEDIARELLTEADGGRFVQAAVGDGGHDEVSSECASHGERELDAVRLSAFYLSVQPWGDTAPAPLPDALRTYLADALWALSQQDYRFNPAGRGRQLASRTDPREALHLPTGRRTSRAEREAFLGEIGRQIAQLTNALDGGSFRGGDSSRPGPPKTPKSVAVDVVAEWFGVRRRTAENALKLYRKSQSD